jgi:hypothetical protein
MNTEQQDLLEEEPDELSLTEIYRQLISTNELILTIPAEEEQPLRKGLAVVKNKQNTKLKESGIVPDKLVLHYQVNPHKDGQGKEVEGIIDVHITLAPRNGITVLSMRVPDPTL